MDETFAAYLPDIRRRWLAEQAGWEERRQEALAAAARVANFLRREFGAAEVIAFGSLVHDGVFDGRSDIDLALRGIPAAQFYRAYAAATAVSPQFDLDLIDLATCPLPLREAILKEGRPL